MGDCKSDIETPVACSKVISSIPTSDIVDKDTATEDSNGDQSDTEEEINSSAISLSKRTSSPTFEDVQVIIGEAGKWQLQIVILASFSGFCLLLHNYVYGFIGAVPSFSCRIPTNYSKQETREKFISNVNQSDIRCLDPSWIFKNASQNLTATDPNDLNAHCTSFEYDRSEIYSSVVTEWNLVCDNAHWVPYIQVAYMLGVLLGSPIYGAVSDRIGRKTTLLILTLIAAITSPLIALSNSFGVFLILRFILGLTLPGIFNASFVIALEITSGEWRSTVGSLFNVPFSIGYTVLPILAYYFRSWKSLQLVCSLPIVLFLGVWWFLPESPRWLIGKGHLEKAEHILRAAAKTNGNGHKVPENFSVLLKSIHNMSKSYQQKPKSFCTEFLNTFSYYVKIIISPQMRAIFFTLSFSFFSITMTYYALGLNSSNLPTDRYSYFFVNGLMEFFSYLLIFILLKYTGRKLLLKWLHWSCAVAMLTCVGLPEGSQIIVVLSFIGKLLTGSSYVLSFLCSFELLPTSVRHFVLNVFHMMGTLGAVIAPLIIDGRYPFIYAYLAFGCLIALAGFLTLLLPETRNRPLQDIVEDTEKEKFKTTQVKT